MSSGNDRSADRRLFLQFLAASPLLGAAFREALAAEALRVPEHLPDPIPWGALSPERLIQSPAEAINLFDFELVARHKVPIAHFAKVATGSEGELTMRANRGDFAKVKVRPRRLRNVSAVDGSITLFGSNWASPIFLCPTGGIDGAMHPDGTLGVIKAAHAGKHLQIMAGTESMSIEDSMAVRGGTPIWFQLYPTYGFEITRDVVARAERQGAPVLVITVDEPAVPKFETLERLRRLDSRRCLDCHSTAAGGLTPANLQSRPNYADIAPERWKSASASLASVDWDFVRRLRDSTKMKVVLKGILTPEDAALCVRHGFDGLMVSSHGGRSGDFGISSIAALPEVAAAVNGEIPILIDSGFRRGLDVVKALAMGATAVGIGRPYLWGLGAFGQAGVERVLEILREEMRVSMAQAGAATVKELVPSMIRVEDV